MRPCAWRSTRGLLKAACVEKQILFLERERRARRDAAPPRRRPAGSPRPVPEADRGDVRPAARNPERTRHVGDRGGVVGPDLQPRAAAPARARWTRGASGSCRCGARSATRWARSLAGRFDRVDGGLRELVGGRGRRSTMAGRRPPRSSQSTRARTPSCWASATRALVAYASARQPPERARLRRAAVREGEDRHRARAHRRRAGRAVDLRRRPARAGGADVRPHQLPARVRGDGAAAGGAAARAGARVGQLRGADAAWRRCCSPAARPRSTSTRAAGSTSCRARWITSGEIGTAALGFVGGEI